MNFVFFSYNQKNCSKSIVQGIGFYNELSIGDLMCENRSRDEYFFKRVKSIMTEEVELAENILLNEANQQNDNVLVVKDEKVIKISEL